MTLVSDLIKGIEVSLYLYQLIPLNLFSLLIYTLIKALYRKISLLPLMFFNPVLLILVMSFYYYVTSTVVRSGDYGGYGPSAKGLA